MKLVACFVLLGFCLSAVPKVNSVECVTCDPPEMHQCKDVPIDCSMDKELGEAFDACYTYEMIAQRLDGSNFTHKSKGCAIRDGCDELRKLMCDIHNKTMFVKSCRITCCDNFHYCNADEEFFAFTPPPSEFRTSEPDVMGYRSRSPSSRISRWVLHPMLLFLCTYFIIG